jgi:pyruvate kinase
LQNLAEAMRRTRKLCAVMIDTIGRELTINRPTVNDKDGWPTFDKGITVNANDKVAAQPCLLINLDSFLVGGCTLNVC